MDYLGLLEKPELDTIFVDDEQLAGIYSELGAVYKKDKRRFQRLSPRVANATRNRRGHYIQTAPYDTKELTGKALFEKRLHLLPDEIRNKLQKGYMTISDKAIYSIVAVTSDHIEMFSSSDSKKKGVINLDRAALTADNYMLLTSIVLLSAASKVDGTAVDAAKAAFGKITPEVANGWFSLSVGQQLLFDEVANEVFNHSGGNDVAVGEYRLETPKIIFPQQEIKFDLDLGTTPADLYLKVVLKGVITVKA